jgi:hypothetical protein
MRNSMGEQTTMPEKNRTKLPTIKTTSSVLTPADRRDHVFARCGIRRMHHRIDPGLYALGTPTSDSPVFVSANYTLSFDALRSSLPGVDGYILVLDTKGINVWCAAGEGTFGTEELILRIENAKLTEVVNHRELILPQLGAPGVSAHEIRSRTGFRVEYGPVRAADLPEYMKTHKATSGMRRVSFRLAERLVLVPIEIVHILPIALVVAAAFYFLGGVLPGAAVLAVLLSGVIIFPIIMPWLPTANFSTKGFILGLAAALPFVAISLISAENVAWWRRILISLSYLFSLSAVTAFIALNFTGSTPFTSRSGVKAEIYRYIPHMAWLAGSGLVMIIANTVVRLIIR